MSSKSALQGVCVDSGRIFRAVFSSERIKTAKMLVNSGVFV